MFCRRAQLITFSRCCSALVRFNDDKQCSAVQCSAMQFLCDTWKMDLCTYLQRGGLQRPRSAKSAA